MASLVHKCNSTALYLRIVIQDTSLAKVLTFFFTAFSNNLSEEFQVIVPSLSFF